MDSDVNDDWKTICGDCGAMVGELHDVGCDVEICEDCGDQRISCRCDHRSGRPRLPWSGEWPGAAECREFGWFSKLTPDRGWIECDASDPNASPDLNRLGRDTDWDPDLRRFVKR
jgi:hypothetical protein